MKKIITGGIFLLSGIILYLGVRIPAAIYSTELGSWSTPPGRFGTALEVMGGVVARNNSVALILIGLVLLLWGCFIDDIVYSNKKNKDEGN